LSRDLPQQDQAPETEIAIAPLAAAEREPLCSLFAGAFARTQPFASLTEDELKNAAEVTLRRAFDGEEGPLVHEASFVAHDLRHEKELVGAIFITLIPEGDPADFASYEWREPPPPDLWETGRGQPHLTWIFTHPWQRSHGIGTRLLAASAQRLRRQGYRTLLSTFLAGNDASQLWHWRCGFELLPQPYSFRRRLIEKFRAPSA
jgi:GNAT superfamily N-acetyltransferase